MMRVGRPPKHSEVHPCFSCPLPDCDETSPQCALRQAHNVYCRAKDKSQLDELERRQYSIAFHELYYWSKRERERLRREAAE